MNLLGIYNKMNWTWKGKQIPLEKLHDNQLNHIKNFVKKYKGNHYGYSSEGWLKAIDYIEKQRSKESIKELSESIYSNKREKVLNAVDNFLNNTFDSYKLYVGHHLKLS